VVAPETEVISLRRLAVRVWADVLVVTESQLPRASSPRTESAKPRRFVKSAPESDNTQRCLQWVANAFWRVPLSLASDREVSLGAV